MRHTPLETASKLVIAFGVLLAFVIPVVGLVTQYSGIVNVLGEDQPGRVLIFWIFLIFISWLIEKEFRRTLSPWKDRLWIGTMAILCALLLFTIFQEWYPGVKPWMPRLTELLLVAPILVLAIFAVLPNQEMAEAKDGLDFHRWGHLASLALMVLALFAFGFKKDKAEGLRVHWSEVPAILIVFVLAELGVALVVKAAGIEEHVTTAGKNAKLASDSAKEAVGEARVAAERTTRESHEAASQIISQVNASKDELTRAIEELRSLSDTANHINTVEARILTLLNQVYAITGTTLWNTLTQENFHEQIGINEPEHFWDSVDVFTKRWDARGNDDGAPMTSETRKLVGGLFQVFVGSESQPDTAQLPGGKDPGNSDVPTADQSSSISGTVLQTTDGISCITADAVFANASQRWLENMRDHAKENGRDLVVWAVTRLLPTDFAFPSLWWGDSKQHGGDSDNNDAPVRVAALNQFVSSVIQTCQLHSVLYRRVTVLFERQDVSDGPSVNDQNPSTDDVARNHGGEGTLNFGAETTELESSLDTWLLWDPRIQKTAQKGEKGEIQDLSTELVNALLGADNKRHLESRGRLSYQNFRDLYTTGAPSAAANGRPRPRAFPVISESGDNPEVYLFTTKFTTSPPPAFSDGNEQPDHRSRINLPHEVEGLVLGATHGFLSSDRGVSQASLKQSDLRSELLDLLEPDLQKGKPGGGGLTRLDLLRSLGWTTLREWYRCSLHNNPDLPDPACSEARWVLIKREDLKQLEHLRLDWGGWQVDTLDLLLIGSKDGKTEDGKTGDVITWHGAAISNLQFDRTECTIKLVTARTSLEAMEDNVNLLLSGDEGRWPAGSWLSWPKKDNDCIHCTVETAGVSELKRAGGSQPRFPDIVAPHLGNGNPLDAPGGDS